MSISNVASDVVAFLNGKTLGGVVLASGTNLFIGELPHEDHSSSPAVAVLNTGGQAPTPLLGTAADSWFRATVQVIVRGGASDFAGGETLARAIHDELHLATVPRTGGGNYVGVYMREASPTPLGADDSNRHGWTLNAQCNYVG